MNTVAAEHAPNTARANSAAESPHRPSPVHLPVTPIAEAERPDYHAYHYFQLLRLVESRLPPGQRLGLDTLPSEEPLRVLPDPALRYPTAEIISFGAAAPRDDADGSRCQPPWKELRVAFGGLYGVQSPLPYHFLDDIARQASGSEVLASFLDIFNHRLYLLQYQAWKKYRYPQQFESQARDRISACLFGLGGLALRGTQAQTELPMAHLLAYIGPFSQRVRNADGLRGIVCEFLGMPEVRVEQLVPQWITVDDVTALAARHAGGSLRLGDNVLLGRRVPDPGGKVRIVIGPVGITRFFDCMPGGTEFADLRALVRLYLGANVEFDLRLQLRTEGLPPSQLRRKGTAATGMRLGWTTFLSGALPEVVDVTVRNCSTSPELDW
ncbi:type VI secretion system baseplate subunit TssG [soil metagenome]